MSRETDELAHELATSIRWSRRAGIAALIIVGGIAALILWATAQ